MALTLSLGTTAQVKAEAVSVSELISKAPEVHQSLVYSPADKDLRYLTSFTVAKWKSMNLDIGYLTEDGLAAAVSCDLVETPEIKYPILKYVQVKPIIGYSVERLFSGEPEKGNGWGIADKETWFFGATLVKIQF
jgi:hypothetical protein